MKNFVIIALGENHMSPSAAKFMLDALRYVKKQYLKLPLSLAYELDGICFKKISKNNLDNLKELFNPGEPFHEAITPMQKRYSLMRNKKHWELFQLLQEYKIVFLADEL